MNQEPMRINKYLSAAGVCSRREADRQVLAGKVKIDGKTAVMGDQVLPGQKVTFRGKEVDCVEEEKILLAVNKPVGIVTTTDSKREENNIVDFIGYPKRIYPVGRLDKDSGGLILMTNQGELVNEILRARNHHEKEYLVTVNKNISSEFLNALGCGVYLEDLEVTTRKCLVRKTGSKSFRIVLTQGLNRQIRRMCEAFGYRVVSLVRVRIVNIKLGNLKPGEYRKVTEEEYSELLKQLNFTSVQGRS